jgi:hypothetical protein
MRLTVAAFGLAIACRISASKPIDLHTLSRYVSVPVGVWSEATTLTNMQLGGATGLILAALSAGAAYLVAEWIA